VSVVRINQLWVWVCCSIVIFPGWSCWVWAMFQYFCDWAHWWLVHNCCISSWLRIRKCWYTSPKVRCVFCAKITTHSPGCVIRHPILRFILVLCSSCFPIFQVIGSKVQFYFRIQWFVSWGHRFPSINCWSFDHLLWLSSLPHSHNFLSISQGGCTPRSSACKLDPIFRTKHSNFWDVGLNH